MRSIYEWLDVIKQYIDHTFEPHDTRAALILNMIANVKEDLKSYQQQVVIKLDEERSRADTAEEALRRITK